MSRVTASEVKDIIDTDKTDSVIDTYILYASKLIDEYLDTSEHNLSADILKEIERWLTAHAIATSNERQVVEQEAGPVRQKFSDVFGVGFYSTTYGQAAINLDNTGTLADLSQGKKKVKILAVKEEHDFRYGTEADDR